MGFSRIAALGALASTAIAAAAGAEDVATVAKAFGARETVQQISLSPDGTNVAMIIPYGPRGLALTIFDPVKGGTPLAIYKTSGDPDQLSNCGWVTDKRLVCTIRIAAEKNAIQGIFTRTIALDADGKNVKMVSAQTNSRSLDVAQNGGTVIDWTGDGKGGVLMTREFFPEQTLGTRMASEEKGLGVERIDTVTLQRHLIEHGKTDAEEYIADGQGAVRIMGIEPSTSGGYAGNTINYFYRKPGESAWQPLSKLVNSAVGQSSGFNPYAVDRARNVVYGFDDHEGRTALYSISLDGALTRQLVLAQPTVDVDGLIRIGRQRRVIGASYATDRRKIEFFDPDYKKLSASLSKALPDAPIVSFAGASADETKLLVFAGSDSNPGKYYLLDRTTHQMIEIVPSRAELAATKLAQMTPISFTASDGTKIPAYLTLPPGSNGKNVPAIVMPHGGPGARDEWGFDWWAQFFVARGFAVLQPNFRGSTGYGSDWFQKNGFQSWRTAIGDVNDAGRWLEKQGIAAPGKLAIVGWSYGGYAALQSAVLDPKLFKAIIAVAPVTDLQTLKAETYNYSNHAAVEAFVGNGPHIVEGSPARNAALFQAPVLMFHGTLDRNVDIGESQFMAARLRAANKYADLVVFKGLDHQLDDSDARTLMLTRSDAFLREKLGLDK